MDKALVGAAGEHYVAFRLSAEGYAVGFTAPGTRDIDLVVTNLDTGKSITVQVKTMTNAFVDSKQYGPYWKWRVGVSRTQPRETFFYCFVDLRDDPSTSPNVFIVPSLALQKPLLEEYPESGPPFTDAWCVIEGKDKGAYLDQWEIIEGALT